jgi:Cdc6-like AAA superfamily ATPase
LELVKYQNDEQRQVCLGWLSQAIYATQQYDYINRRQPGTGAWVLESPEFQTWIEKSPQTMFCPGIPGAGKTILASIVVDELESRCGNKSDVGIAYIFCSFQRHDDQSQKLESLMASIVRQLAQGLSPLPEIIESLHEKHRIKGTRPSVHEISIALRFIIGRFSRLFIIVDALDECHNLTISQLLNVIFDLQATENLNFLATSRFIPDIVTMFQNMPTLEIRAAKVDVMEYLVSNLHKLPLFVSRDPQLQQDIVTSITNSVDGM